MNNEQKIIKNKVGLLKLAETLGSVSDACKVMGYSRDSFYRLESRALPPLALTGPESVAVVPRSISVSGPLVGDSTVRLRLPVRLV